MADVVGRVKLDSLLDKPVLAVSTGEMSRVLVARALIRRPRMLILDEPFEGLDRSGRQELKTLLDGLAASGLPMVLVTHRSEEMPSAFTHVLTVEKGRITSAKPAGCTDYPLTSPTAVAAPAQKGAAPPEAETVATKAQPALSI
jgi:ABC-type molybdenum transport system ATPase subunit/photorepair protein PhrA